VHYGIALAAYGGGATRFPARGREPNSYVVLFYTVNVILGD